MGKLLIIISIVFCGAACHKSAPSDTIVLALQDPASYPVKNLRSQLIDLADSLICPIDIWCIDSLLAVYDRGINDGFLRIYSLTTGRLVGKFGQIGRGPGEYLTPGIYQNSPRDFLITVKSNYSIVNIDSILMNPAYQPKRQNTVSGFSSVNYANLLTDSLLFYWSLTSSCQFSIVDMSTGKSRDYSNSPRILQDARINDFIANTKIYHASKHISTQNKNRAVMAYKYFPILDFVAVKDFKTRRIQFPLQPDQYKLKVIDSLNAVLEAPCTYYRQVFSTSDYVYGLYYGDSEENIFTQKTYPEIHRFDWEGNFTQRYGLNKYITRFCTDEKARKIYAIGLDCQTGESPIYAFSF